MDDLEPQGVNLHGRMLYFNFLYYGGLLCNAIWWWQQQTLRKLMKNMTRKSWIFWNWQSLPELSDLEKSDLKIRSRSVKKRSTIRSRSWSRKMVESDLRSDQKVICRSRSWSVDQDRHYFGMTVWVIKLISALIVKKWDRIS